jgi:hypothetical protein
MRVLLGRRLGKVTLRWEPRDLWVGAYWKRDSVVTLYVCLLPCLPIVIWWWSRAARRRSR